MKISEQITFHGQKPAVCRRVKNYLNNNNTLSQN